LPRYPALTPKQTELLFAIWEESRFKPLVQITHAMLAKKLKEDEGDIRKTIAQLRKISDKYFIESSTFINPDLGSSTPKGKNTYLLNDKWVAAYPETAALLLELANYTPESEFRIDRRAFEQHAVSRLKLSKAFVRNRLDKAIAVEYVKADGDGIIYPDWRINCEKVYLSLIATFYNPENPVKMQASKAKGI
jgi:hypothetical protein